MNIDSLLNLSVNNISDKKPFCFPSKSSVADIYTLFKKKNLPYAVVTNNGKLDGDYHGVVTKRDVYKWYIGLNDSPENLKNVQDVLNLKLKNNKYALSGDNELKQCLYFFSTAYLDPIRNVSSYLEAIPVWNRDKDAVEVIAPFHIFRLLTKISMNYYVYNWMSPYAPPKYRLDIVFKKTNLIDIFAFVSLTGRRSIPVVESISKPVVSGILTDKMIYEAYHASVNAKHENIVAGDLLDSSNDILLVTPCTKLIDTKEGDVADLFLEQSRKDFNNTIIVVDDLEKKNLVGVISYINLFQALLSIQ